MGLRIGFGQMGNASQKFVNPQLAQRLRAFESTAGQNIDYNDIPNWNAIENIPGTPEGSTDLYRDVSATDFVTVYAIHNRWGIDASRSSGIATFDLKSGWNMVKNASIISDVSDFVQLDGFVHFDADYSQVGVPGVNVLEVTGSKSGNFLGGAANDDVSVGMLSNGPNWNNEFHFATGGGRDTVNFYSLDLTAAGIGDDITYSTGQWLTQRHNTSGEWSTTYVDLGDGNDIFFNTTRAVDNVWGGAGNDQIFAGAGNDFLNGGSGNDMLFGGSGADIFAFDAGHGQDRVGDFRPWEGDKLQFSSAVFASAEEVLQNAFQRGTELWIDRGNDQLGDYVILTQTTSLTAADIIIV